MCTRLPSHYSRETVTLKVTLQFININPRALFLESHRACWLLSWENKKNTAMPSPGGTHLWSRHLGSKCKRIKRFKARLSYTESST